uniref:Uncharacterized protein n=1 Tax=Arundo donax TaxID=35708 RepID=A0A0A8Y634_ARUDO
MSKQTASLGTQVTDSKPCYYFDMLIIAIGPLCKKLRRSSAHCTV